MNGCNYPSFADDVRQLKTSNDNNHGAGLFPFVVIFCCCRAVRNEPENETISDPAKMVVITCNDNMSSYMTTRQTKCYSAFSIQSTKRHFGGFSTPPFIFSFNCIYGQNDLLTDAKRERIQKQTFPE